MSVIVRTRKQVRDAIREALENGEPNPLLSISDVVALTGFHKRTLRRYVDEGVIPHERLGPTRRIYFRWSIVQKEWPTDTRRL